MKKKSIGVGLMGMGVIGSGVVKAFREKANVLSEQIGCPLVLRKIKERKEYLRRPSTKEIEPGLLTADDEEFFSDPGIDIIIEVIGGENPAFEYQKRALSSGRHVVTANKELIAKRGIELLNLAQKYGVGLHYEASVGGGIPLIVPFQRDLVANRITSIYAIINGTTNYILTRMAKEGVEFSGALSQAQKLGYAEANPENDIEGIDAAYKLAIMASLAFHTRVQPKDIHHEGISRLNSRDFRYAKELGFAIKLLAIGKQSDNFVEVRVHPVFIPEGSLLAKVEGVYNSVLIDGDLTGRVLFFGRGAGPLPTSSAILADVVSAARDIALGVKSGMKWIPEPGKHVRPMSDIETRYYLRMNVRDQAGVLAQISTVLGNNMISISSVIQKETDKVTQTAEIVIMTHPAREKAMQKALKELTRLGVVKEISNFVRVEAWEE